MRLFEAERSAPTPVIPPLGLRDIQPFVADVEIFRRFSQTLRSTPLTRLLLTLTGLRRSFHGPYGMIAERYKLAIEKESESQYL